MSSPGSPPRDPREVDDPRTVIYDPNDLFWQDTEDDNDDMDYFPAEGDTENGEEEEEEETDFHGKDRGYSGACCAIKANHRSIDAAENLSGVEFEVEIEDEDDEDEGGDASGGGGIPRQTIASMNIFHPAQ